MPTLSIIMPVYRAEALKLAEAITSVMIAAPDDSELHIGLDGPCSQEELQLLESIKKKCGLVSFRVTEFPKQGLVATLNSLIKASDCKFLARQDSDDFCLPKRLEHQLTALKERTRDSFCGTQVTRCDQNLYPYRRQRRYPTSFQWQLVYASLLNNPIAHPTLMVRRELLETIKYRPIPGAEDWDLYVRLWQEGHRSFNLSSSGLLYRIHAKQITQQARNKRLLTILKKRSLHAAALHHSWAKFLQPIQMAGNAIHLTELGIRAKSFIDQ